MDVQEFFEHREKDGLQTRNGSLRECFELSQKAGRRLQGTKGRTKVFATAFRLEHFGELHSVIKIGNDARGPSEGLHRPARRKHGDHRWALYATSSSVVGLIAGPANSEKPSFESVHRRHLGGLNWGWLNESKSLSAFVIDHRPSNSRFELLDLFPVSSGISMCVGCTERLDECDCPPPLRRSSHGIEDSIAHQTNSRMSEKYGRLHRP